MCARLTPLRGPDAGTVLLLLRCGYATGYCTLKLAGSAHRLRHVPTAVGLLVAGAHVVVGVVAIPVGTGWWCRVRLLVLLLLVGLLLVCAGVWGLLLVLGVRCIAVAGWVLLLWPSPASTPLKTGWYIIVINIIVLGSTVHGCKGRCLQHRLAQPNPQEDTPTGRREGKWGAQVSREVFKDHW